MILDLLLFYFVGKAFYNLAHQYDRSRWGFAILGVISCYGGILIGGIVLALIYELGLSKSIAGVNPVVLGLMGLPFGILVCWIFYLILKKSWIRSSENSNPSSTEVLDADLFKDNQP